MWNFFLFFSYLLLVLGYAVLSENFSKNDKDEYLEVVEKIDFLLREILPSVFADNKDLQLHLNENNNERTTSEIDQLLLQMLREMDKDPLFHNDEEKRHDYASVVSGGTKWNFLVKYAFADVEYEKAAYSAEEKEIVREGFRWWSSATCLNFVEYPNTFSIGNSRHLRIFKGLQCSSNVGPVNSDNLSQNVSIGVECLTPGVVAHEIGHFLGLGHEFIRPDRNEHVRILFQEIPWQFFGLRQELKISKKPYLDLETGYDLTSIMHYGSTLPKLGDLRIIETVDPYKQSTIGQRTSLSFIDAKRINLYYNCPGWSCSEIKLSQPCQNGGYQDPRNCARCRCPPGIGGDFCENLTPQSNCGGKINVPPCTTAVITSPDYPGKYAADSSCSWLVETNAKGLIFGFTGQPDMACTPKGTCLDFVEIRPNISRLDRPGARFCKCGRTAGRVAAVDASQAFVYFESTSPAFGGGDHHGFRLNVFATCYNVLASEYTFDCKIDKSGYDYEGFAEVGDSGDKCMPWAGQTIFPTAASFPDGSLLEAGSFCRNPDSDVANWCFINANHTAREFCTSNIPKCYDVEQKRREKQDEVVNKNKTESSKERSTRFSRVMLKSLLARKKFNKKLKVPKLKKTKVSTSATGCRETARGIDYNGTLSTTRHGYVCQRWDSHFPHSHPYVDKDFFADGNVKAANNYCRNPDRSFTHGVWCLTTDRFVRWDICNVPRCAFDANDI